MAFFDKLNDLAKNVGDKTKEAMEISKLNAKIRTEKAAIEASYKKLGVLFYEKHAAGEIFDEAAEEIFAAMDASNTAITELEAEIAKIKAEKEAGKAPAQGTPEGVPCPVCGKLNTPGAKFCGGCGNSTEPKAPVQDGIACPNCGTQNPEGTKFCGSCGTKLEGLQANEQKEAEEPEPEEPVKKVCPSCGVELAEETKFCSNCGTKIE